MKDFFKCTHRGSVSHGTLRNQDLIPAFLDAIQEVAPDQYSEVTSRLPADALHLIRETDWGDSDDAQWLLDELFDILDEHSPEGHYFGAHPGDGADFGFWAIEEN